MLGGYSVAPVQAAFTLIQSNDTYVGNTCNYTNHAAHNILVVVYSTNNQGITPTISNTNGDTWSAGTSVLSQDGITQGKVWYVLDSKAYTGTDTVTIGNASDDSGVMIYEFHDSGGTALFDNITTGRNVTTLNITTAVANELLVSFWMNETDNTRTLPAALTQGPIDTVHYHNSGYLLDAGAAGSKTTNWACTANTSVMINIAFKPAGGAAAKRRAVIVD
jgi:hypothetical protein